MHAQKGFSSIVAIILGCIVVTAILLILMNVVEKKDDNYQSLPSKLETSPKASVMPSQTPIATNSAWIKYVDQKNGFELEYPEKYVQVPRDENDTTTAFDVTNKPNADRGLYAVDEDKLYHEIFVMINPEVKTMDEIAEDADRFNNRKEYSRKDFKLDGHPSYLIEGVGLDARNIRVATIKDGKEYMINLRHFSDNPDRETFMRVVNSFKFL